MRPARGPGATRTELLTSFREISRAPGRRSFPLGVPRWLYAGPACWWSPWSIRGRYPGPVDPFHLLIGARSLAAEFPVADVSGAVSLLGAGRHLPQGANWGSSVRASAGSGAPENPEIPDSGSRSTRGRRRCRGARPTTCHRASIVSADRSAPQSHSTKYPPFTTFANSAWSRRSSNTSSSR